MNLTQVLQLIRAGIINEKYDATILLIDELLVQIATREAAEKVEEEVAAILETEK